MAQGARRPADANSLGRRTSHAGARAGPHVQGRHPAHRRAVAWPRAADHRADLRQHHKVKESGIALLLADENANHVAGLADRVYLLETGSLVREGPADTLLKDQALLESYLG